MQIFKENFKIFRKFWSKFLTFSYSPEFFRDISRDLLDIDQNFAKVKSFLDLKKALSGLRKKFSEPTRSMPYKVNKHQFSSISTSNLLNYNKNYNNVNNYSSNEKNIDLNNSGHNVNFANNDNVYGSVYANSLARKSTESLQNYEVLPSNMITKRTQSKIETTDFVPQMIADLHCSNDLESEAFELNEENIPNLNNETFHSRPISPIQKRNSAISISQADMNTSKNEYFETKENKAQIVEQSAQDLEDKFNELMNFKPNKDKTEEEKPQYYEV